jgi:hypothetical protein
MKLEKRDIDIFLTLWIKNDRELWGELRDIQIKLLVDRIIKEKSYKDLALEYKTSPQKIKEIFEAILHKIDSDISSEVAKHLRIINSKVSARPDRPFSTVEVFLN